VLAFLSENLILRPRAYPLFLLPRRGNKIWHGTIQIYKAARARNFPRDTVGVHPPRFRIRATLLCERPPVDLLIWRSIGSWLPAINFLCTPLHIKSVLTSHSRMPNDESPRCRTPWQVSRRFVLLFLLFSFHRILSSKKKSRDYIGSSKIQNFLRINFTMHLQTY